MVSTLSRISPVNTIENPPPALLPGMGITANCLLHNYLPKTKDLVILVSDSPQCAKTHYCTGNTGGMPCLGTVSDSDRALSRLSWGGEGKAAQGQRGAACPQHTPHDVSRAGKVYSRGGQTF